MVTISELECNPVIRNAVVRYLKTDDAADLRSVCVCDLLDIPNLRLKRIYGLQTALQAHGLSLAPCRFVPQPIRPGRKTPDHDHQVNRSGTWEQYRLGDDGEPTFIPVPEQEVDLPPDAVTLVMLANRFGVGT